SITGSTVALSVAAGASWASKALEKPSDDPDLVPRLGETSAEFEARIKGLARPLPTPSVVTIPADSSGHFFVQAAINGTQVRMMVDTVATGDVLSREDARRIGCKPPSCESSARS